MSVFLLQPKWFKGYFISNNLNIPGKSDEGQEITGKYRILFKIKNLPKGSKQNSGSIQSLLERLIIKDES